MGIPQGKQDGDCVSNPQFTNFQIYEKANIRLPDCHVATALSTCRRVYICIYKDNKGGTSHLAH
jgi:hypothetical protein